MPNDHGPKCGNCGWRWKGRCKVHRKPVEPSDGQWCPEHSVYFTRTVKERFRREILGEGDE